MNDSKMQDGMWILPYSGLFKKIAKLNGKDEIPNGINEFISKEEQNAESTYTSMNWYT